MQFSPQFIDDLVNRLQPSQIIGRHVKLTHKANGEYVGICPFHKEKTPSFSVSDNKEFYHCFGCSAHGNIIKFTMEIEGLGFVETITKLADIAGIAIPKQTKDQQIQYEKQLDLYDLCEEACKWFEKQLSLTNAKDARGYLDTRKISAQSISKFRLGFAPDNRSALKTAMINKGYNQQQLIETGLIIQPENTTSNSYDRFRKRIIFPIMDLRGKIIAFGGRILGEGQPKYLNSPETPLFHKGSILYGFSLARQSAYDNNSIIATEGYMDVIAMSQAGITNVIAPLGTAITENQLKLMWKVAKEPILCMDGDAAGKRSMAKAAKNCLPLLEVGYSLRFTTLPSGLDPDDIIQQQGKNKLAELLQNAKPLSQTLWDVTRQGKNLNTPEHKALFESELMQLAQQINDQTIATYYRRHFKELLWETQRSNKGKKSYSSQKSNLISTNLLQISPMQSYETFLVLTPYYHPELLENQDIEDDYNNLEFSHDYLYEVRNEILETITDNKILKHTELKKLITDENIIKQISQLETQPIDPSIKPHSTAFLATKAWDYTLASYQSQLVNNQYLTLANATDYISDSSHERLIELKKHADLLKKLVNSKFLSYEAALDE